MKSLETLSDDELVNCTLQGDVHAYDEIVNRYQQSIAQSLYRFCPNKSDLEDLLQESLIKSFQKLDKWKRNSPLEAWLKTIAINHARDHLRKIKRRPTESLEVTDFLHTDLNDQQNEQESKGYTETVQHVLSFLSDDERSLLTLFYLEEMPLKEIAKTLNWSLAKTKIKNYRAKQKLQKLIKNHEAL